MFVGLDYKLIFHIYSGLGNLAKAGNNIWIEVCLVHLESQFDSRRDFGSIGATRT
jgi:hypothetical protein